MEFAHKMHKSRLFLGSSQFFDFVSGRQLTQMKFRLGKGIFIFPELQNDVVEILNFLRNCEQL